MKKNVLTSIALFAILFSAQASGTNKIADNPINPIKFRVGLVGGFGPTAILNQNALQEDLFGTSQNYQFSTGYRVGILGGVFFTDKVGIELDVLYGTVTQKYEIDFGGGLKADTRTDISSLDIPLLLKLGSRMYFEVGPQFSFITASDFESKVPLLGTNTMDVKDEFEGFYASAVMGFGGNISVVDKVQINIGLRVGYGLTDIKGVDGQGNDLSKDALYTDKSSDPDNSSYESYKSTRPAFAMIKLGVAYKL